MTRYFLQLTKRKLDSSISCFKYAFHFFGNKVGRVFVTKFFQDKRANNFLKYLENIEECEPDNVRYEYPKVRRKYYKYKNSTSCS